MALLERTNSGIFAVLLGISAIGIAFMAAFFSVTGLSMVYAGSSLFIAVAMGVLEFSKLITASFLYRYWDVITFKMKTYLTSAVVILMIITSGGIYGYLTNAYQGATINLDKMNSQTQVLDQRKQNLIDERQRLIDDIAFQRDERQSTIDNRNEEIRTNNLATDSTTVKYRAYRNRKIREDYDAELVKNEENISHYSMNLDSVNVKISRVNDNISSKKLELIDTGVDVGPLVYMARIFNTSMDTVMNWFSIFIVLVFDPLSVVLIIAYNFVLIRIRDENFSFQRQAEVEQVSVAVDDVSDDVKLILEELEMDDEKSDESDEFSLKEGVSTFVETDENDENFDLGEPDDLSFMKDAKPVEQAFDDIQKNLKSQTVISKVPDLSIELDEDFAEALNVTTEKVGQDEPTKERIVLEPAKSGNIPKEKIQEAIKAVKESDDVVDLSDAVADDGLADEIVGLLSEEVVKSDGPEHVPKQENQEKNIVVDVKVEENKINPLLSDDKIMDEFDEAARKARATAKETIEQVSYEAGGSVDFAIQE